MSPRSNQPTAASPPRRILIVRLSAIGDVIHGMPVLRLADAYPRAVLAWVVEKRAAALCGGTRRWTS